MDARHHFMVRLANEEYWKLKEVAAKQHKRVNELVAELIAKIIMEEHGHNDNSRC